MTRPPFENIKTYEEFEKYYWYREELVSILKKLKLNCDGEKKELMNVVKEYFNGTAIPPKRKRKIKAAAVAELTLDTKLIECGFTFGPKFREFFAEQTGDKNFKYTADTVATVKAVKERNDTQFTLGDLLDVKTGKTVYAKYDKSSCLWNKFLKDFCADKENGIYPDKLKTASKFWNILRDSDLPKVYSREFIENNKHKI